MKSNDEFLAVLEELDIKLPFDEEIIAGESNPLAQPLTLSNGFTIGNRFCVHPMEGWDAETDGNPSELVFRRLAAFWPEWRKLIWGGELLQSVLMGEQIQTNW